MYSGLPRAAKRTFSINSFRAGWGTGGSLSHFSNSAYPAAGYAEFEKWLSEPPVPQPARNEFMLKVLFAARGKPEYIVQHIEAFHQYQVDALKLNTLAEVFLKGST